MDGFAFWTSKRGAVYTIIWHVGLKSLVGHQTKLYMSHPNKVCHLWVHASIWLTVTMEADTRIMVHTLHRNREPWLSLCALLILIVILVPCSTSGWNLDSFLAWSRKIGIICITSTPFAETWESKEVSKACLAILSLMHSFIWLSILLN